MSNYCDLFNELLDEKIYDIGSKRIVDDTPRDFIEEKTIEAIEKHIDFFRDIPKEDIRLVFEDLIEILYRYDTDKRQTDFNKLIEDIEKATGKKKPKKKACIQIDQDIKTIQKYQAMIERLYGVKSKKDNHYIFLNMPKQISDIYKVNKKIIDDLEQEKFKIINRLKYHNIKKPTKNNLKIFLKNLVNTYNLKNFTDDKKPLIDSI